MSGKVPWFHGGSLWYSTPEDTGTLKKKILRFQTVYWNLLKETRQILSVTIKNLAKEEISCWVFIVLYEYFMCFHWFMYISCLSFHPRPKTRFLSLSLSVHGRRRWNDLVQVLSSYDKITLPVLTGKQNKLYKGRFESLVISLSENKNSDSPRQHFKSAHEHPAGTSEISD